MQLYRCGTILLRGITVVGVLICLTGCRPNQARLGSYLFTSPGASSTETCSIELKPHDDCVVTESGTYGTAPVAGKYTIDGDTLSVTVTVWGTTRAFSGHFEGTTLVMEDGLLNYHDMHFTKQQ